jgi:hypothetical protein
LSSEDCTTFSMSCFDIVWLLLIAVFLASNMVFSSCLCSSERFKVVAIAGANGDRVPPHWMSISVSVHTPDWAPSRN